MKRLFLAFLITCTLAGSSIAQRVPAPSPSSTIQQAVGITDFTVSYSRPSLKGRQAFGPGAPLAPAGQVWRTGANQATTLEASTDFTFGGKTIPAGKYALFSIPNGSSWTVILNKNYQGGIGAYSESNDVARVQAGTLSTAPVETFTIGFSDLTETSATLALSWAGVTVPVKLEVATDELTTASLKEAVAKNPEDAATLQTAATYMLGKEKDLDQALALADKSIGLKESFANVWLKAQILNKLGKVGEAVPLAEKALALGKAANFASFYQEQIETALSDWKTKLPAVAPAVKKGKRK